MPLFAEGTFHLILGKHAQGLSLMAELDLFDDLIEVFVIVFFACDEIKVPWGIFLVIVLTFDLGAKRTGVRGRTRSAMAHAPVSDS